MLMVNQLIGFGVAGSSVQTFGTVYSATLTSDNNGLTGLTTAGTLAAASMTVPGGTPTQIRFTAEAGSSEALTISAMTVGHKGAGDAYDFAATPVTVTFDGGSATKVITAGNSAISDAVNFAWDKTSDIVWRIYYNGGGSSDMARHLLSGTGISSNYKVGNATTTVDETGFTSDAAHLYAVNKIETDGF